jgi:hypothetical protein
MLIQDPKSNKSNKSVPGKQFQVRHLQYRDLESIDRLCEEQGQEYRTCSMVQGEQLAVSRWRKMLGWLPHPFQRKIAYFVADFGAKVHGVIPPSTAPKQLGASIKLRLSRLSMTRMRRI